MKIDNLLAENITSSSNPDQGAGGQAPKFGRSEKFLEDETIEETTTSGAIATNAAPVGGMQRRGKGSIFSGIKTSKKFANSDAAGVTEGSKDEQKIQPELKKEMRETSDASGMMHAARHYNKSFIITAELAEGGTKKYRIHAQSERVAREKFSQHYNMAKVLNVEEEGVAEEVEQIDKLSKIPAITGESQFDSFRVGRLFSFKGKDYVKQSNRTARLLSNGQVFIIGGINGYLTDPIPWESAFSTPHPASRKIFKSEKAAKARANSGQTSVAEGTGQQLSVQQLAQISDAALDSAYGYGRSSPGNTFGWQANLKSAAFAKQMIDRGVTDIEAISDAIHKGWNVTAQAFVKNPDQFDDSKTMAPEKLQAKIAQRQKLMTQQYAQLPEDEKEKDRVVARAMLQAITGEQGVAEAKADPLGPWIAHKNGTEAKQFKTREGAKKYVASHEGFTINSSERFHDTYRKKKDIAENSIDESEISENDLILKPGISKRLKPGFVSKADNRIDREVEMALVDLKQANKNSKSIYLMLKDVPEEEGIAGWVQEKIIKASDYLKDVKEYLEGPEVSSESSSTKRLFTALKSKELNKNFAQVRQDYENRKKEQKQQGGDNANKSITGR